MTPRMRFAPSPTGEPHIGNLHTALFSWALARSMDGDFILRIEDTDMIRNEPGATTAMLEAMSWLDLDWDEGPDIGGPHAPYVQSQRADRHLQVAAALHADGQAYYGDDADRPESPGSHPLRLRLPRQHHLTVADALRGTVTFPASTRPDPVLVRSDGRPTYHLAAMVDDHDMGITHVVRGEEWLPSAPAHAHLYRALGWLEPVWVHLPLILNRRGEKLKKRDPEGGYLVADLQAAGYLPRAVWNYLLLLGWSPDGEAEIVDRRTVRRQFHLDRLSRSPSIFDWDRLNWVNRQYLLQKGDADLAQLVAPYLEGTYGPLPGNDAWLVRLIQLVREGPSRLIDFIPLTAWAFEDDFEYTDAAQAALRTPPAGPALLRLIAAISQQAVLLDEDTAQRLLKRLRADLRRELGVLSSAIFKPIRFALTGSDAGPPLAAVCAVLGKERTLTRLARALRWRAN